MSHRKIRFTFLDSQGNTEVESLWAKVVDEGFEVDNIPFYVTSIACGDVIEATEDAEGLLWYSRLVKGSGHSTVQVLLTRTEDVPRLCDDLRAMGCDCEISDLPQLVAVDIPPNVEYRRIKSYLDSAEGRGELGYQEACLGFLPASEQ
jgi:hypothetical protein